MQVVEQLRAESVRPNGVDQVCHRIGRGSRLAKLQRLNGGRDVSDAQVGLSFPLKRE